MLFSIMSCVSSHAKDLRLRHDLLDQQVMIMCGMFVIKLLAISIIQERAQHLSDSNLLEF